MDVAARRELWATRPRPKLGYQIHILMPTQRKSLRVLPGMKMKSKSVFMRTLSLVQPVSVVLSGQEQTV